MLRLLAIYAKHFSTVLEGQKPCTYANKLMQLFACNSMFDVNMQRCTQKLCFHTPD